MRYCLQQKLVSTFLLFCITLLFSSGVLHAQEKKIDISKITYTARQDGEKDAKETSTTGWLLGATGASLILSPLIGGLGTVAIAYSTGGDVNTPPENTMRIKQEYGEDFDAIRLYSDSYEKKYKEIRRKKQGSAAWSGTGIGFLINLLLIASLMSE